MQPPSCHRPWPWSCYTSTVHTGQAQQQAAQSPSRNLSPLPPTRKVLPRGIQQCGAVLGHTAAVTRHGVWHPSDHTQGPWKLAGTCALIFRPEQRNLADLKNKVNMEGCRATNTVI